MSYGLAMDLKPAVVIKISFLKIKYLSAETSCAGSRKAAAARRTGQQPGRPWSGRFARGSALVGQTQCAALSLSYRERPLVLSV